MEPINLAALTWGQWARVALALAVYLGPGMGISIGYAQRKCLDKTQFLVIAIGSTLAGWTVLYAWLNLLNISVSATSMIVISVIAWLYFCVRIWRAKPKQSSSKTDLFSSIKSLMLWAIILAVLGIFLWIFKDFVAGLGSDSYHHTLISQLIYEQGQLPENYLPYAPLVTFRYHFGYHAMVATLSTLSGIIPRLMVLISGPLLLGLAALSTGYLAEIMSQDRLAAVIAAAITGLVAVFPAYMLNWARYTQLAGLALMPILLGLVWRWISEGFPRRDIPMVSLMAAGLALTHYRVTIMAMVGILILLFFHLFRTRKQGSLHRNVLVNGIGAILLAALLTSSWILHIALSYAHQEPTAAVVSTGKLQQSFFSISRIGQVAMHYPTNIPTFVLTSLLLILSLCTRKKNGLPMFLWAAFLLLLSGPRIAGTKMDTVSIVISLYLPAAVIIGVGAVDFPMALKHTKLKWGFQGIILLTFSCMIYLGLRHTQELIHQSAAFVRPSDLEAADWIRENTPEDALFMVNTARFGFTDRFIIGVDAGISLPMVYGIEAVTPTQSIDQLDEMDILLNEAISQKTLMKMLEIGITHIFIGSKGGKLSVDNLESSSQIQLEYKIGDSYIFRVFPEETTVETLYMGN